MKRMYSRKQLEEIIKANSTRLYEHSLTGDYTNANGDYCTFDGLIFISTNPKPFTSTMDFINIVAVAGLMENEDTEEQYNVISYDYMSGRLIYNIDGTSGCECDHEDSWAITQDVVTPI